MASAVIVIDVQQGACEGENTVFDAPGTISRINLLTRRARAMRHSVVMVQHQGQNMLQRGTREWQFADSLEVHDTDTVCSKHTPDAFNSTRLVEILSDRSITQLLICGMYTEYCVDTTVRRALSLGYPVTLVTDAHSSAGNTAISPQLVIAHHNITLSNIMSFGARVTLADAADCVF